MIFCFYLTIMSISILLSLFNLRQGDVRLTSMAVSYFIIVAWFHLAFMTFMHIYPDVEFYLLAAGAQGVIAFVAYTVGCKAAKIIMPLAWAAVIVNCVTFVMQAKYPHLYYYWAINFIQCAQVSSLIFASTLWHGIATKITSITRKKTAGFKRMSHESAG